MNAYAVIIAAALLLDWALGLAADLLNLTALHPEVPDEFRDVYDPHTYRRSQEYTRARTQFGIVSATANLAILLFFWFAGGFPWLDRWVSGSGLGSIWTGLAFIGVLALAHTVVNLPFRLYSTFVIENRFGFNRTTLATFGSDLAKGLALTVLLGGPLLASVLYFFEHAGPLAWLYCWIASTIVTLAVQFIAPIWILPLFNRFTPVEDGELSQAIRSYAHSVAFPLQGIFVMDGSRRTSKSNAFFMGFGKNKRIALFDTLLAHQTTAEVVSVVAHEIGHYKRHHVPRRLVLAILHAGVLFWILSFFLSRDALFTAFGMEGRPLYAGLVFFGLLYTPVELVLSFLLNAMSRRDEYAADRFAAETTGQPEILAAALKRLSSEHLANLTPHPLYVALNHSHPPVLARLAALRSVPAPRPAAAAAP